jgi:hypothetical protein
MRLKSAIITAVWLHLTVSAAEYRVQNRFGLSVTLGQDATRYSVLYKGQSWMGDGIVSVYSGNRWYRSADLRTNAADGKLTLRGITTGMEKDRFGAYDFVDIRWALPAGGELVTGFRLYKDNPYLIFTQSFPNGFASYASGDSTVPSVVFPQFMPGRRTSRTDLAAWSSTGLWAHKLTQGDASSIPGTVDILLLADRARNTLVLSPFANYLVATQESRPSGRPVTIDCGIEGQVSDIPAGYEHKHILVAGTGIHDTFEKWGRVLLERAGKPVPSKYADDVLKYLVYMDDYGSYYREHGFKESGYKTYADVILGVEKEAREHGVNFGSYHVWDQDQLRYAEGLFEPKQELVPEGPAAFDRKLGKPMRCYYLWMQAGGPYRKQFPFYETAQPGGWGMGDIFYSLDYWRYTAKKMASWGCISLQHDYLSRSQGMPAMMSSIDTMDTYMRNMTQALKEQGMTIHYCMQLARHVLQSSENPIMVSLQGSDDHHVGMAEPTPKSEPTSDQGVWNHHIFVSAFYGALGIWPCRDNVQTGADPNAFEDLLLANLLGGSVELGHRIGEADWDLIRRVYREGDGLVLKPDRPIAPLDRSYFDGAALGYTESNIGGRHWYYVLSLPPGGYASEFSPTDLGATERWAVLDWDRRSIEVHEGDYPVRLAADVKHQYFVIAPVFENGTAVFGDLSKFVTMADQRIAAVEPEGKSVRVTVISSPEAGTVVSGYSRECPARVEAAAARLPQMSSLYRVQHAKSGWFWDPLTGLWSVKLDFSGANGIARRSFTIR